VVGCVISELTLPASKLAPYSGVVPQCMACSSDHALAWEAVAALETMKHIVYMIVNVLISRCMCHLLT
jgi:hypothetical protein